MTTELTPKEQTELKEQIALTLNEKVIPAINKIKASLALGHIVGAKYRVIYAQRQLEQIAIQLSRLLPVNSEAVSPSVDINDAQLKEFDTLQKELIDLIGPHKVGRYTALANLLAASELKTIEAIKKSSVTALKYF